MKKVHENTNCIVARFYNFTPEQLKAVALRMEVAAKERCNPGESITVEVASDLIFYYDPKVLRGDLERRVVGITPSRLTSSESEVTELAGHS